MERGCEGQNEDKGRKRKIGEREGGESGRGTERRDGEHKQTLSLWATFQDLLQSTGTINTRY